MIPIMKTLKEIITETSSSFILESLVYSFVLNRLFDSSNPAFIKRCLDLAFVDNSTISTTIDKAILRNDFNEIKQILLHGFTSGEITFPIIDGYVKNLIHQIDCMEETTPSDLFAIYVPQLRDSIIHYEIKFFHWRIIDSLPVIPAWRHLIPASFPADEVCWEDPDGVNILQLSDSAAENLLIFDQLPEPIDWRGNNLGKIINTKILNEDAFTEPLIAVQFVEQLMNLLGFEISTEELDDREEFQVSDDDEDECTASDRLYSRVSIYHILAAQTGGMYYD